MAKLILINKETETDTRKIGDVVGIEDDSFVPSETMKVKFDIVSVDGVKANIELLKQAATPRRATLKRLGTTGWVEKEPERKECWLDGKDYKEIVEVPPHDCRWDGEKFVHNFDRDVVNTTKITVDTVEAVK
jgi:hypothetical protein